jgi:NADP-dependent 3-hydroxy acid dehydrogenase YdfG
MSADRRVAVVTGASIGIGAATVRRLCADGFDVVAGARRQDRLAALAAETGCRPVALDVTDESSVQALAAAVPVCSVLVNNAGGARGLDPVVEADDGDWQWMYETNVLGLVRVTRALFPALLASGDAIVVNVGSTAGLIVYEGGGGYAAAKHAVHAVTETLRLELAGQPVRVTEIAPGLVQTEEFSLNRFHGDADRAEKVYAGVRGPLTADDIADCIGWVVSRPWHVDIDLMVVRPRAQAAQHKLVRDS